MHFLFYSKRARFCVEMSKLQRINHIHGVYKKKRPFSFKVKYNYYILIYMYLCMNIVMKQCCMSTGLILYEFFCYDNSAVFFVELILNFLISISLLFELVFMLCKGMKQDLVFSIFSPLIKCQINISTCHITHCTFFDFIGQK